MLRPLYSPQQSAKGYVNYLIELFFKPEYTGFQATDGYIATKGAKGAGAAFFKYILLWIVDGGW